MKLEARIEKLEQAMAGEGEQHDDRAGFRDHVMYAVSLDGSVIDVPGLNGWPDEVVFWDMHTTGTRFLRLNGANTDEVVDGVSRPVRFRPFASTPDARRAMDELHRDIIGEWPNRAREVTP